MYPLVTSHMGVSTWCVMGGWSYQPTNRLKPVAGWSITGVTPSCDWWLAGETALMADLHHSWWLIGDRYHSELCHAVIDALSVRMEPRSVCFLSTPCTRIHFTCFCLCSICFCPLSHFLLLLIHLFWVALQIHANENALLVTKRT